MLGLLSITEWPYLHLRTKGFRSHCDATIASAVTRPKHLPDFKDPPLHEVVLGVQFRTPANYQQIYAGKVWELYRSEYPNVEEYPALSPNFETFGSTLPSAPELELVTKASHDRFWFLSESGYELIQFQSDRLIHNWRKMGVPENQYPRFEVMIEKFEREMRALEGFMASLHPQELQINQCEATYINVFPLGEIPDSRPASWFRGFDLPSGGPENFKYSYTRNIIGSDGKPSGRLYIEAQSALRNRSEPVVQLQISARGAPDKQTILGALEYLRVGRELIVSEFAEITSERAQAQWERLQ